MLNPIELSATAPGSASRGTMSPTDACQAGLLKALPQPMAKVKARRPQGDSQPCQAKTASIAETISM